MKIMKAFKQCDIIKQFGGIIMATNIEIEAKVLIEEEGFKKVKEL